MIENSFIFLPGIGAKKERKIWQSGILTWNDFLEENTIEGLGKNRKLMADRIIMQARNALREGNASFFTNLLPSSEHWRLYDHFRDEVMYLDIETSEGYGYITVIGLYDGREVMHMVRGVNLERGYFDDAMKGSNLLITFNGRSFDVPVINRYFRDVVPDIPHFDLRHLCARLGLTGGLKSIEIELGICRDLDDMDGAGAVLLWDLFRIKQDMKYLKKLLAYNAEDVLNLKPLADHAVSEMKRILFQDL